MFLVKTIANSPLKIVNNRHDAPPIAMIRYSGCRNIPIICYFTEVMVGVTLQRQILLILC